MKEIIDVKPLDDYKLLLVFKDNEKRIKDMKPYLNKGIYKDLKNKNFFNKVKIEYGTISWDGRIDLCADELYTSSYEVKWKNRDFIFGISVNVCKLNLQFFYNFNFVI